MIGLDTNVLVRYLTRDDLAQWRAAVKLVRSLSTEAPGFLSLAVLVETVWVLESSYDFKKRQVEEVLEGLLRSQELSVERAALVWEALRTYATGRADFSDCVIERCSQAAGCSHIVTFDRSATMAGMRLLS
jgi:predicted nucleic-acid-binding protein